MAFGHAGGRDTDAPHPLSPSVGAGFYPAPTLSFRASAHTGVGIRSPLIVSDGLFSFSSGKRTFRAPARITFGHSPKSDQKVCLKPKVSRLPARYALLNVVGFYHTHGRGDFILSCGQEDCLCVCAAAADLSHGRTDCVYISEQTRTSIAALGRHLPLPLRGKGAI